MLTIFFAYRGVEQMQKIPRPRKQKIYILLIGIGILVFMRDIKDLDFLQSLVNYCYY